MGTSDSYVHQGGPKTDTDEHRTLTTRDPSWERKVADFADAGINSMREPKQSRKRAIQIEPIAEQVAERAADVADRLVAAASRRRPSSAEPAETDRILKLIIDEVFDGGEYGSERIDALIRRCAVDAASRWLQREAAAELEATEPQEPIEVEEILVDPLGVVAPELVESAEPLQQLVDEFLVELLVELIQVVGGEAMFPGLSTLKLLWALYRWAAGRLLGSRVRRRQVTRMDADQEAPTTERELLDELLGLDERAARTAGATEPEEAGNG